MRCIRTTLGIAIAVLAATAAAAQTGGISVVVTDANGPLPGATVTISHETGFVATTASMTDVKGVVDFPVLRPGKGYSIEISFPGYTTIRQDSLQVSISGSQRIPIQMIGDIQEKVEVFAKTEVIDLEQGQQSTKFSQNFISDLPVPGRYYTNVLTMSPGVQDADGDGNPNVHGSRSRDFQAIVSGVNNVDPLTGQQMSRINPNSIEEMEVITAGAGVEFGRAQGGFARIIQKQGSNTHEGVAELYYSTSKLDGDGAFNGTAVHEPQFDTYQPSFQLSGPIIKDKLWYRASLEFRDIERPTNVGTGVEISKQEDKTNDFQVTWQVAPRNKLALQYRQDPRKISNVNVSSLIGAESSYQFEQESQTTTLTWTAPYSPKVLVESVASWSDQNVTFSPNTVDVKNGCITGQAFLEGAQCFNANSGQTSGSLPFVQDDHRQRLGVQGTATVYGGHFLGMSHQFKLGATVSSERYFRQLFQGPFLFYFVVNTPDEDTTGTGEESPEPFGIGIADVAVPETDDVRATGQNWGFYAEDQFKPRQNLTVTLGARVDREEIVSEGHKVFDPQSELDAYLDAIRPFVDPNDDVPNQNPGDTTRKNPLYENFTAYEDFASFESQIKSLLCDATDPNYSNCISDVVTSIDALSSEQKLVHNVRAQEDINLINTNFSPYLSVAWDPFSNQKMAIKASAGRHYNNIPLIVPLQELQPASTTLVYKVDLGEDGGARLLDGISPSVNVNMVDRDLQTPYQDEFTISFERELWAETSINLTYVNRKFRDQLQDKNINVNSGDYGKCHKQTDPADAQGTIQEVWGEGGELTDDFTGQTYVDTDPGPGDGRIDDCVGETVTWEEGGGDGGAEGDSVGSVVRPDGIVDLYKLNPFWGDILLIGNFNEIDYESYGVELVRRQYRSWELNGSYVYSTAEGDGEDFQQGFDNDPTVTATDVKGYQAYDQRHVVKLNATTVTPWGIRMGTAVSWQSGLPYSLLYRLPSFDTIPPQLGPYGIIGSRARFTYPTGVRNDQRNKAYWNVDLRVSKELNLARGMNLQVSAEVFNVFDEGTYKVYNQDQERGVQINGVNESFREFGRSWTLGAKLAF